MQQTKESDREAVVQLGEMAVESNREVKMFWLVRSTGSCLAWTGI